MNGKRAVTLYDKKKAKGSIRLFGALSLAFIVASALSIVFIPRSDVVEGINNDYSNKIVTFTPTNYGDSYTVASSKQIQRYNSYDNELLETVNYADEISTLLRTKENIVVGSSQFVSTMVHYEESSENNGTLYIFDSDGDIFKYNDVNKQYTLDESNYYVTDSIKVFDPDLNSFVLKKQRNKLRSLSVNKEGSNEYIYTLWSDDNNYFYIAKFDSSNLNAGPLDYKYLYKITKPGSVDLKNKYGSDSYILNYISFDAETVYNIAVEDSYVYAFTSQGLIRYSSDFNDYENTNYFKDLDSYINSSLYSTIQSVGNSFKEKALGEDYSSVINSISGSSFKITQSYLALKSVINAYLDEFKLTHTTAEYEAEKNTVNIDSYIYAKEKLGASYVEANKTSIKGANPHLNYEKLVVANNKINANKANYINLNCFKFVEGKLELTNQKLGGIAYNKFSKTLYYIDLTERTLNSLKLSSLSSYGILDSYSGLAAASEVIPGINFDGYTLYDNRSNISYDKNTHNLLITYYCDKDVTIVDTSKETPEVKLTFSVQYDIRSFFETRDETKLVASYEVTKRLLDNSVVNPIYVMNVNPNTYKYRSAAIVLMIVFLVLATASVIAFFVSLKVLKNAQACVKAKVIGRDLKKHKFTYMALIPFVVLLIMFCWVEAIGSISFSFFDYSKQKPAFIWNNLGNFIQIFNNDNFWLMMGNTAFFLAFDLFFSIVPPIIFAFFLSIIKNKKMSAFMRACMFIPAIIPGIASLLIWKLGIFGDTGILNQLICLFKTGSTDTSNSSYQIIGFLNDSKISRWSLLLMGFPYVGGYLIFYGGMMNVPKEYDEACQLEGVSVVRRFLTIDLPLIKPQIKYILVIAILGSVQNYERTYMLGSNGTTTLVETMYRTLKMQNPDYGLASAYATFIFLLLIIPVFLNFRNTKKQTMGDAL